jgi:DNA-binding transcriptional LysR family regulator
MLDPRLLRVLHEVARTGSFSAAGRALGCSQPAVTQQMSVLERAVGAPVAVRVGRSMRLTDVGQVLARHTDEFMRTLHAAEEEVRGFLDRQAGTVRVAAFASACATLLPRAMGRLAGSHPFLQVRLLAAEPAVSLAGLRAGECDVAVCYGYTDYRDDEGLLRQPLLCDQLLLVVAQQHPATRRRKVRLADFADDNWIAGSPRAAARLKEWTTSSGYEPQVTLFVDDYVALQALVASGRGVGVVPGLALEAHRHPGVRALHIEQFPHRRVYAHCWPQMRAVPAVASALDALRAEAARLASSSAMIDVSPPPARSAPTSGATTRR